MPESNDQQAFFIDDELIERLMRGDAVPDKVADKSGFIMYRRAI